MESRKKKILIIEDDPQSAILFSRIVKKENYNPIIAEDGKIGLSKFYSEKPDAAIIDLMLPEIDGVSLIKEIRKTNKQIPIFVATALYQSKVREDCINAGVNYFFNKPVDMQLLLHRIKFTLENKNFNNKSLLKLANNYFDFVGVGIAASTGGPLTLQNILRKLPFTDKAAYFIVLHAPDWMLEGYSERLNNLVDYEVHLAKNGMRIKKGEIYIAPGNYHMKIHKTLRQIELDQSEPVNFVRPSADPLFESISEAFGEKSVGLVLTGMGHDGSAGCAFINYVGGKILVQDPDSAVIHGMPSSVINLGLADHVVDLEKIPNFLLQTIEQIYEKKNKEGLKN